MGLLVDGVWQDVWYNTNEHGGRFVRSKAQFRNWVTADGSTGFGILRRRDICIHAAA